jgi:hypothetical protein
MGIYLFRKSNSHSEGSGGGGCRGFCPFTRENP